MSDQNAAHVVVCFYDRSCYPRTWLNRFGHWLIDLFSRRWVHVDIHIEGTVITADARAGRVLLADADDWPRPAFSRQVPGVPRQQANDIIAEWVGSEVPYGWIDFLLAPFRPLIGHDGSGVICSEITADILVAINRRNVASPDLTELARAIDREGSHALTPADLHRLVRRYLP